MEKNIDNYLKRPYTRILLLNDDSTYSAEIMEFPGCFAFGNTADEAIHNLNEAARSWLEACNEKGIDIPEPSQNLGYSGKIALRLPKSLHRQAINMAEREGVSLNQFLASTIAARLGAGELYNQLVNKFEHRMANTAATIIQSTLFRHTYGSGSNQVNSATNLQIMDIPFMERPSEVQ